MADKILDVVFFQRIWPAGEWQYADPTTGLTKMLTEMKEELCRFGIQLRCIEEEFVSEIRGYQDLLNSMRVAYPAARIGSLPLGRVIGVSKSLDIVEDLRRGINRVAFAPETVEPSEGDKIACHDCGCGC